MVGFDEDLNQIMETLTVDESNLQILSIVGMGGIGKTTLAKNVFDNPLIEQHFDLRAWVTISQQYIVHEILLGLLKDIGALAGGGEEITQKNDDELGLHLHRSLFNRRYFIVMDDVWSIQVWDDIKRFFPDNNNGSRVMITTRLLNVADNFRSCTPHQLHCLDKDRSWDMPQLRHLRKEDGDFYLPDPPSTKREEGWGDFFVLKNLRTLYKIRNFRCTDEVIRRIPNIKKLGINYRHFARGYGWHYHEVNKLVHLCNLESLFLECDKDVLHNLCYPHSLKKLTLSYCRVSWEDLTLVGLLLHLEVLKLKNYAVLRAKWNPVEGEFLQLKSLQIENTNLEKWIADSSHFPLLENFALRHVGNLKEIPYSIGEIPTLETISLKECSDSANSSAKEIQKEQQNLGNDELRVHVHVWRSWKQLKQTLDSKRLFSINKI